MHQTDDLALWPVVRRAGQNFLRRVQQFYVFNFGKSSLLLTRDRTCYAIGKNQKGCLGVGPDLDEVTQPTEVVELRGITIVACHSGLGHVMVLTSDGHLWGWGWNRDGQVGCGNLEDQYRPVLVMSGVHMVRCGGLHTAAFKPDGTLWCWGSTYASQLDLGHTNEQTTPSQVTGLTGQRVVYIDCGAESCVALTDHPRIYHWGMFDNHKLISTPTEVSLPSRLITSLTCGMYDFTFLGENGHVHHCYYDNHSKLHCDPIELEEPVHSVNCINLNRNGEYYFKLRSGEVTVWNPKRVIRTTLTSVADACALYSPHSVTPELTTLPRHVISEPVLRSITQFNDIDTSDFVFNWIFDYISLTTFHSNIKRIYLNKKIASKLSPYLAAQFQGSWKDQENVEIRNYSFVVYFTYLRYILTDTLPVIEPDWAIELLSLAIKTQTTELADQCFQVIQSTKLNLAKMITDSKQKSFILNYLTKSVNEANYNQYYQLAVEVKSDELQEKIVQFIVTLKEKHFLEFIKGNIDQLRKNSKQWSHVSGHLTKSLTSANCCFYYQLAVEAKDDQIQEQIVRFVANRDPSISTLIVTNRFQQTTSQNIKNLLTRCAKFLKNHR